MDDYDHVKNNLINSTIKRLKSASDYNFTTDISQEVSDSINILRDLGGERALEGLVWVVKSQGIYLNHHAHAIYSMGQIVAPINTKVKSLIACYSYIRFGENENIIFDALSDILSKVGNNEAFDFFEEIFVG